jgi:hypothetical protein
MLRLTAGLVALVLFGRAARTSWRVLRRFDVHRSTEGQLALERHAELASTFVRVATVVQVALLALTMLVGDRLSGSIRGAMCAFGVFHATPWGFRSLCATATTAVAAGVVGQLHTLDVRVRSFDLVRPLAQASLLLAAMDFGLAIAFTLDLDLSVVASCCSVQLDSVASGAAGPAGIGATARNLSTLGAVASIVVAVLLAWRAYRDPRESHVVAAALGSVIALPFALAASVLEVAPHAFEIPQHVCPFCLLRPSVLFIGYPLYAAVFIAVTSGLGAGIGALVARSEASRAALSDFARREMRREALAWGTALLVGAMPVARYFLIAQGASLFH